MSNKTKCVNYPEYRFKLPPGCNSDMCKSCEFVNLRPCSLSSYIKRDRKTGVEVEPYHVMRSYKVSHKLDHSTRHNRVEII